MDHVAPQKVNVLLKFNKALAMILGIDVSRGSTSKKDTPSTTTVVNSKKQLMIPPYQART